MIRVIVSEKPSMGRAIASALGITGTGRNFIQADNVIVTWCVGHLATPVDPEVYDPDLKTWKLDPLPFYPKIFRYVPIAATKSQYDVVAGLLTRKDVVDVVNATDAGREGELIFDLVYHLSGCKKPVKRFWTSSLTDNAIRDAYAQMKPGNAYRGLRDAAYCRQEADWLVGINCTRAQTLVMRNGGGEGVYSVGRVQTPTLALLVNREIEITNFVARDFWTLIATFQAKGGTYQGKWFQKIDGKDQTRFDKEEDAKELAKKLTGLPGKIASVTTKQEAKKPERLYDLTNLQKEANRRFGFTAEHTLELAQDLYEAKLISYPRTNSRYLTAADAEKAPNWIRAIAMGQLSELQPFVAELRQRWPVKLDGRFVNDKEVEDHPALTPTENPAKNLQGEKLMIYDLIARRFLAAFFPDRIEDRTIIITLVGNENFRTTGIVLREQGWSAVDPPHIRAQKEKESVADEESGLLPAVSKAEMVALRNLLCKAGKTMPPKNMTEADLLGAMQTAGRDLGDDELKGAMKDCGLGTPATRANIIETLVKRDYVIRNKNILRPTSKGIALIQSIQADNLKSPQMTGEWEAKLERMRRDDISREEFMAGIRSFVTEVVGQIKQQASTSGPRVFGSVVGKCPKCGSDLMLRNWKGKHYVKCADAEDSKCMVVYDTDASGKPLERCRFCQGPIRTTKGSGKICVTCNKWQTEREWN